MSDKLVLLLSALLLSGDRTVHAQSGDALVASVITGGGVSGGATLLGGTIGQWDAAPPSDSPMNQTTGFWNTEPLPWLRIQRTSGSMLIAWPASFTGFQLQQSAALGSAAVWVSVSQSVSMANGENQVSVTIGPASRFFRLHQP